MTATIETERLILRPPDAALDFEAWAVMMADAETMRYIGGSALNRGQAWRTLATMIGHWQMRGYGMFSVIEKATGDWIGRVGPWYPEGWDDYEIGWGLTRAATGKGYATEAAKASMDYAFQELNWPRVIHYIDPENTASQKVAERLGSKYLRTVETVGGVFDGTCDIYGQTLQSIL